MPVSDEQILAGHDSSPKKTPSSSESSFRSSPTKVDSSMPGKPSRTPTGRRSSSPIPTEEELIAFNHVAAGHEGISSNVSGSLVIKPCTQAEIDFYESTKLHEHFQAHIPTFIGTLSLQKDQNTDNLAPLLAQAGQPISIQHTPHASTSSLPPISELLGPPPAHGSPVPLSPNTFVTPISSKRASWKPSGGKKLDTGLAIVLENVAAGFTHPNILDVKLGSRLWADDAPASKRRKLDDVSRETTSGSLGFRIAGMKLWMPPPTMDDMNAHVNRQPSLHQRTHSQVVIEDDYRVYDKHYGRSFNADNVREGFIEYLGGKTSDHPLQLRRKRAKLVARRIVRELESIQYILETEESRMYSASILMVYEGDEQALEDTLEDERRRDQEEAIQEDLEEAGRCEADAIPNGVAGGSDDGIVELPIEEEDEDDDDDDEDQDSPPKVQDVRLIDFAHASWTPGQGPDENVLRGVREVIRILRHIAG